MDIVTKSAAYVYRCRQQVVESYGRQADSIQQRQLRQLLRRAEHTEWGKAYDYRNIRDYAAFAERIPLQTYDTLRPFIGRMINGEKDILWPSVVKWYAKSSGTTNTRSKFIPVTPEILKHCHYRGGYDTLGLYLRNYPDSRFFSRKGLILGGSHNL